MHDFLACDGATCTDIFCNTDYNISGKHTFVCCLFAQNVIAPYIQFLLFPYFATWRTHGYDKRNLKMNDISSGVTFSYIRPTISSRDKGMSITHAVIVLQFGTKQKARPKLIFRF